MPTIVLQDIAAMICSQTLQGLKADFASQITVASEKSFTERSVFIHKRMCSFLISFLLWYGNPAWTSWGYALRDV